MHARRISLITLLTATALTSTNVTAMAQTATSDAQIQSIEKQIKLLQQELGKVRQDLSTRDAQVKAAQRDAAAAKADAAVAAARPIPPMPAPSPALPTGSVIPNVPTGGVIANNLGSAATTSGFGTIQLGGVTVTLGGFLEAAGIFRTANEASDVNSSFNSIPFSNSPASHLSETRFSARQSRFSLLAQGAVTPTMLASLYFEADLLGAAPTANSNESNSYTPRVRQIFAAVDDTSSGFHFLAGQAWSLLTLTKQGLTARTESMPLTIDAQSVPGFTWARQPQFRVTKDFNDGEYWLGASLENPQTTFGNTSYPAGSTVTTTLPGNQGGLFFSGTNYSVDAAPDLVLKAATDQKFGHFEVYGVGRLMRDRVSVVGSGNNNITPAGGAGAAALVPIIKGSLELQASALAGAGIGRYGSGGLPDATIASNGSVKPIPEVMALVGLIGHPTKVVDTYAYIGTEQESASYFNNGAAHYGYGNPGYINTGCVEELNPAACVGNTSGISQLTLGYWWRAYQGSFGTLMSGTQYSYTRRDTFQGVGGAPHAIDNMVFVSLRYYPFNNISAMGR